jgi:hypothetical protein
VLIIFCLYQVKTSACSLLFTSVLRETAAENLLKNHSNRQMAYLKILYFKAGRIKLINTISFMKYLLLSLLPSFLPGVLSGYYLPQSGEEIQVTTDRNQA